MISNISDWSLQS